MFLHCKKLNFDNVLIYTWHLLHFCPSWERDPSHVALSEVSTFFLPVKRFFSSFSLLLLRVKGRGCHTLLKPYETNCGLWIWAIQIKFDWLIDWYVTGSVGSSVTFEFLLHVYNEFNRTTSSTDSEDEEEGIGHEEWETQKIWIPDGKIKQYYTVNVKWTMAEDSDGCLLTFSALRKKTKVRQRSGSSGGESVETIVKKRKADGGSLNARLQDEVWKVIIVFDQKEGPDLHPIHITKAIKKEIGKINHARLMGNGRILILNNAIS